MSTTRRDEILNVATLLFARHGFKHTTLDAIAGACGLGKTAIYHYFDGKQAIFGAAVAQVSIAVLDQMRLAADQATEPVDKIASAVRARFQSLREFSENLEIPTEVAQELGRISLQTRDTFFHDETALLQDLIEQANAAGACAVDSPAEMAAILSAMFRGVEEMLTETSRFENAQDTLERAVALVTLGLRATVTDRGA